MGFLGFGKKKDDTIDLTEKYFKDQEKLKQMREEMNSNSHADNSHETAATPFGFFANMANSSQESSRKFNSNTDSEDTNEKRRKLAKRLMGITDKLEELSNQIYHLQQRVEVLERRNNIN
jgi:hypothetical protein